MPALCVGGYLRRGLVCGGGSGAAVSRAGVAWRMCGAAVVAFPAAWVTSEYVRNLTTPHGSAGSLAYSQLKFLPFLQLASITGRGG